MVFTEIAKAKAYNRDVSPVLYNVYAGNIFQPIAVQCNNSFQEMNCVPTVLDSLLLKSRSKSTDELGCFLIESCEGLFYNSKYVSVELMLKH